MSTELDRFVRDVEDVVAEHDREVTAKAAELERQIVVTTGKLRRTWIELAGYLHEFSRISGWEALGYASFREWLADPRFDMTQSEAYRLVQAYREFVVNRGVDPQLLGRVHWSKVQVALPAVRRNQVEPARAIADTEALAYGDLRERYAKHSALHGRQVDDKPIEPDDWIIEACPRCGLTHRCVVVDE